MTPQRNSNGRLSGIAFILAILLAAMLWGSTGTLQAQLPADRVPMVVGTLRLAVGALTLIAFSLLSGARPSALRGLPWRILIAAGVAIGLYNLMFFRGVSLAGVGVGTAITIGSAPLWVLGYEILFRGIRPSQTKAFGLLLCLIGLVLLSGVIGAQRPEPLGVFLGLGAGACYALYSQLTSRVSGDINVMIVAAATFTVAAIATAPVLFVLDLGWLWSAQSIIPLASLGVLSTGVAYALYTWGLRGVLPSTAVTLALAEPLTAFCLAVALLGESFTAISGGGVALLLLGLLFVTRTAR